MFALFGADFKELWPETSNVLVIDADLSTVLRKLTGNQQLSFVSLLNFLGIYIHHTD